jgi:hypothetical protein
LINPEHPFVLFKERKLGPPEQEEEPEVQFLHSTETESPEILIEQLSGLDVLEVSILHSRLEPDPVQVISLVLSPLQSKAS